MSHALWDCISENVRWNVHWKCISSSIVVPFPAAGCTIHVKKRNGCSLASLQVCFTWLTFDLVAFVVLFVQSLLLSTVVVPLLPFSEPNGRVIFAGWADAACWRWLKASSSGAMLREHGPASLSFMAELTCTRWVTWSGANQLRKAHAPIRQRRRIANAAVGGARPSKSRKRCQLYDAAAAKWR